MLLQHYGIYNCGSFGKFNSYHFTTRKDSCGSGGELNVHIDRYNLKIAQRKGHAASGNEGNTEEGEVNEGGDVEINPVVLP